MIEFLELIFALTVRLIPLAIVAALVVFIVEGPRLVRIQTLTRKGRSARPTVSGMNGRK